MKKYIVLLISSVLIVPLLVTATTTSSASRGINIDGTIEGQKDASNGTNGTSWELNEALTGNFDTWYISWDNTNLYIGREGGNNSEPQIVYIQAKYSGASYTSTPQNYDGFTPDFSGMSSGGSDPAGINFVAYLKNGYDEYRTWNGSSWSSNNTLLIPYYSVTDGGTHNMEITIPWNSITNSNGVPSNIRLVLYQTNGINSSIYCYGETPTGNPDGSVSSPSISNWWGGYSITSGVSPNSTYDQSLPVSLTDFSAEAVSNGVKLSWTTESEIENLGFILSRKVKGESSNYTKIASYLMDKALEGFGSTTEMHNYVYTDKSVIAGMSYTYLLSDVSYDGVEEKHFDKAVSVSVPVGGPPVAQDFKVGSVYPNPFNATFTIPFILNEPTMIEIALYDMNGNRVKTVQSGMMNTGEHFIRSDASDLSTGLYIVKVLAGDRQFARKLMLIK